MSDHGRDSCRAIERAGQQAERRPRSDSQRQMRTRSAILIGRFWSMLFRIAMPVRHDIAPGARIGQLHVFRRIGLSEDQIAHAIVAAAVPSVIFGIGTLRPLAEALGDVDLVAVGDLPRLALERLHVEPPLLAVERDAVALVRHVGVQRVAHRRAVRVASRSPACCRRCRCPRGRRSRRGSSRRRLRTRRRDPSAACPSSCRSRSGTPSCASSCGSCRQAASRGTCRSCRRCRGRRSPETSTGSAPSHQFIRSK